MNRDSLKQQLCTGIEAMGLDLPSAAVPQLLAYLALLEKWNAHFNLTAVREPAAMVTLHLLDSLALLPHVTGDAVADLGSGAGLPGIPLALSLPDRRFTLVDSNGKKVRFLRAVVRELGLAHVEVVQTRAEHMDGQFDCITTRAFASVADMLAWGGHLLAARGRLLAMKGRYPEDELKQIDAPFRLVKALPLSIPGLDAERHLLVIEKTNKRVLQPT